MGQPEGVFKETHTIDHRANTLLGKQQRNQGVEVSAVNRAEAEVIAVPIGSCGACSLSPTPSTRAIAQWGRRAGATAGVATVAAAGGGACFAPVPPQAQA